MAKRIFIVPYRDRVSDKERFLAEMKTLLADTEPYEIYFAHQYDQRPTGRRVRTVLLHQRGDTQRRHPWRFQALSR